MSDYTIKNLAEVDDVAAVHGLGETNESRFAGPDLDAEQTGVSHHRIKPGKRLPFNHSHERAEEIYVVIAGDGRIRLDDDIVEVGELDAIRIAPPVVRGIEAGPDGIEVIAFGPHRDGDSKMEGGPWPGDS